MSRRNVGLAMPINWPLIISIPSGVGAAIALWMVLGFPTLATSNDIQKITRSQADAAIEIYSNKQRGLIATTPPIGTVAHEAWKEEIDTARRQLKAAEDRKIELSK